MFIKFIEEQPMFALDYMERIVNNGSKSGFTDIHNTSVDTNPFFCDGFYVKKLIVSKEFIKSYGVLKKKYSFLEEENFIFIHPDWESLDCANEIRTLGRVEKSIWVIPTSSSRTVRVQGSHCYLKLHYPGMIGRLNRELKYSQLISGLTISDILNQAKLNNAIPDIFDIMSESYGRLLIKDGKEIGFICREMPESIENDFIIPAFSLFSMDRNNPKDELLLHQILDKHSDAYYFFVHKICFPIIDIFFACTFNEGLIPEMHSQNVLFVFERNWNVKKIILRDFESIDKDITIRQKLGKSIDFVEFPYKCISDLDENYLKRHSFMYDHKLCEYLIEPLIECAASYLKISVSVFQLAIKDYLHARYFDQILGFFPLDNCWYKYPDLEIDRSTTDRPFVSMGEAIYR